MRLIPVFLVGFILAGCSTRPPTGPVTAPAAPAQTSPVGAADTCGATPYLYLIGEEAEALERVLILRQVRVIWPEDSVDGTSRPERLNFNISPLGTIASITCG